VLLSLGVAILVNSGFLFFFFENVRNQPFWEKVHGKNGETYEDSTLFMIG